MHTTDSFWFFETDLISIKKKLECLGIDPSFVDFIDPDDLSIPYADYDGVFPDPYVLLDKFYIFILMTNFLDESFPLYDGENRHLEFMEDRLDLYLHNILVRSFVYGELGGFVCYFERDMSPRLHKALEGYDNVNLPMSGAYYFEQDGEHMFHVADYFGV